eukprot:TRINITY_DN12100_c0_g2_i1.p1 TRINITY_DN12100_c0_g2~~TRINITY_DN12100_c0_g2_i1.p1  ORF type:complete len:121 (-),score=18.68 TRINITY_DN12100_c0_g2_i1:13-375(-)
MEVTDCTDASPCDADSLSGLSCNASSCLSDHSCLRSECSDGCDGRSVCTSSGDEVKTVDCRTHMTEEASHTEQVTCSNYSCNAGWTNRSGMASISCADGTCTDEQCCKKLTCSEYSCGTG